MLREIPVHKIEIGMYVAELDRPWLGTPFPTQGFYIRDKDQVIQLTQICDSVFVDPRRIDTTITPQEHPVPDQPKPKPKPKIAGKSRLRPVAPVEYEDAEEFEHEVKAARGVISNAAELFQPIIAGLASKGVAEIQILKQAVDPLVDSVLRNKDALITLLRVQKFDSYTYSHCISVAIWATLLGRQLGFRPEEIKTLALACSLQDVGKLKVPKAILDKPGPLEPEETKIVAKHVEHSLDMLTESDGLGDDVLDIVRWHHERCDGSGYPDGLVGDAIPIFARIAGLVDSYDAMTSTRPHAVARSSFAALLELREISPELFQTELVEHFTQAIGIFPNGSLVELSTGEVAIVIAQNIARRLRPKIMLILDDMKRRRNEFLIRDLSNLPASEVSIARELGQGEFGINAEDYFV
ncbi:MAG: HD-GYP domain-containing protein [Gammaproteobacteria bacterium]|nr:HD-GYP domain-containing protein [Gammaproteobacteria bacterium]